MSSKHINIKKNELLRQFEYRTDKVFFKIEYSEQGKNIFLTRFEGEQNEDVATRDLFFKSVLDKLSNEELCVVPTCPSVAAFFKKHRAKYKHLLPIGINL